MDILKFNILYFLMNLPNQTMFNKLYEMFNGNE